MTKKKAAVLKDFPEDKMTDKKRFNATADELVEWLGHHVDFPDLLPVSKEVLKRAVSKALRQAFEDGKKAQQAEDEQAFERELADLGKNRVRI